jgi:hypothetical protein
MPLRFVFESARSLLVSTWFHRIPELTTVVQFTVSLLSKTRSFLEEPAWKTEPWRGSGLPTKSPQNELVDILIDLPGFLQDVSEIENGIVPGTKRVSLIEHLRSNLAVLYHWRWSWQRRNPDAVWEIEPADLPPGKTVYNSRLFPKVLWFRTFTQATEIQLYNAVLLCTLGLLWQFEPQGQTEPIVLSSYPLRMPGQYNSLHGPAEEICRAFEYQLLNVNNTRESALFWLLPLGIAHKVLQEDPRYSCWIQSMLDMSKLTRGYGSGTNEFAFGHYEFLNFALSRQRPGH